jgi:hypothetical protein
MRVDEKIFFYKKDREQIGGEIDRLMLLDLPDDFGLTESKHQRILNDIRDFANGSLRDDFIEPLLLECQLEGSNVCHLHWIIDETSHFHGWFEMFRDACVMLGFVGTINPDVRDDHMVMLQRSKILRLERDKKGMTLRLGMTLKQGLDRAGFDALYRRTYLSEST